MVTSHGSHHPVDGDRISSEGGMDLVNGGDLDAALGLLNGPGVDANGDAAACGSIG